MKNSFIISVAICIMVPIAVAAQKKSINGLWRFPDGPFLMEFADAEFALYGQEPREYRIEGRRIVIIEDGEELPRSDKKQGKYKLRGNDQLVLFEANGQKFTGTRIRPGGEMLPHRTYSAGDGLDIEFIDGSEALFSNYDWPMVIKYIIEDKTLYLVQYGRYATFEIEGETFRGLDGEFQGMVFKKVDNTTLHVANEDNSRSIRITDGSVDVSLEITPPDDFVCIGIHFSDKSINWGTGTYIEIKKVDGAFVTRQEDSIRYSSVKEALEDCLRDIIIRFYDRNDRDGAEVWETFIRNGGLDWFIENSMEWIDDEFLLTPFNNIYG